MGNVVASIVICGVEIACPPMFAAVVGAGILVAAAIGLFSKKGEIIKHPVPALSSEEKQVQASAKIGIDAGKINIAISGSSGVGKLI